MTMILSPPVELSHWHHHKLLTDLSGDLLLVGATVSIWIVGEHLLFTSTSSSLSTLGVVGRVRFLIVDCVIGMRSCVDVGWGSYLCLILYSLFCC